MEDERLLPVAFAGLGLNLFGLFCVGHHHHPNASGEPGCSGSCTHGAGDNMHGVFLHVLAVFTHAGIDPTTPEPIPTRRIVAGPLPVYQPWYPSVHPWSTVLGSPPFSVTIPGPPSVLHHGPP